MMEGSSKTKMKVSLYTMLHNIDTLTDNYVFVEEQGVRSQAVLDTDMANKVWDISES